jgi:hypothetical protein
MIMISLMMLDVLRGSEVAHNNMDDGRCFGNVDFLQVIEC